MQAVTQKMPPWQFRLLQTSTIMSSKQRRRWRGLLFGLACTCLIAFGLVWRVGTAWIVHNQPRSNTNTRERTVDDFSLDALDRLADKIAARQNLGHRCKSRAFGSGWGHHELCTLPRPSAPCFFYSFGIGNDYSFDVDLANTTGCLGYAADPNMQHPSKLHPRVFFSQMAATSLDPALAATFPFKVSPAGLRLLFNHERIHVLKMDCEGCEYAIARDVLELDPDFFHLVDQFVVEVHYSRRWIKSVEYLRAYAGLITLLEEAGMELVHFEIGGCSSEAHATGILPELARLRLSATLKYKENDLHCHNYLFARVDGDTM